MTRAGGRPGRDRREPGAGPDTSRDPYTVEAFHRHDATGVLQVTPDLRHVANPANDPDTDSVLVRGIRLRVAF